MAEHGAHIVLRHANRAADSHVARRSHHRKKAIDERDPFPFIDPAAITDETPEGATDGGADTPRAGSAPG